MLQFSRLKIFAILGVLALGVIFSAPNLFPQSLHDRLPSWLPATTINLGLDLQGGSHLLFEVDTVDLLREKLDGVVDEVRDKLRTANIRYAKLGVAEGAVQLSLLDPAQRDAATKALTEAALDHQLEIDSAGAVAIPGGNVVQLKAG